jgi:hypothetical protein
LLLLSVVTDGGVTSKPDGTVPRVTGMVWFEPSVAVGLTTKVTGVGPLCRLQTSEEGEMPTVSAAEVISEVTTVACTSAVPPAEKLKFTVALATLAQLFAVVTVYVIEVFGTDAVEEVRVCEVDGEITRPPGIEEGTVTARVFVPVSAVAAATLMVAVA